jgi:restriction system protein
MTPSQPCFAGNQPSKKLKKQLRERLLEISYPAFERCIQRLLTAMGYTNVLVARSHFRGRNCQGGWDLEATTRTGVTTARVIAQIKQYKVPVQKRYVDELRGTMLRAGARQGLLITTSSFSPTARQAAAAGHVAPIRLVDGEELLNLLIRHGIGVQYLPSEHTGIDLAFFNELAREFPASPARCPIPMDRARSEDAARERRNADVLVRITFGKEGA